MPAAAPLLDKPWGFLQTLVMNVREAHRFFAADCFNRSWDLIDRDDRTREEDEEMLFASMASHYHWKQRDDYDETKASIAYWHTSRIYSLLGDGRSARDYAERCLAISKVDTVPVFYEAYAHEALARSQHVMGNEDLKDEAVAKVRELLAGIDRKEERDAIEADLKSL
ncbi:MAG: hypothetical protein AAGI48_04785 [Verrucomicrobiota bacterium]